MRALRDAGYELVREIALGAWFGLWVLGVGGRIAMRAVALALGQPPVLNTEGTFTVVVAGAAAGAAGALLHALSAATAARLAGGDRSGPARGGAWVRPLHLTIFAMLLALVTARGLRGSPGPTWPFWLLVTAYGATLGRALHRRSRGAAFPAPRVSVVDDLTRATPAG